MDDVLDILEVIYDGGDWTVSEVAQRIEKPVEHVNAGFLMLEQLDLVILKAQYGDLKYYTIDKEAIL